MTQHAPPSLSIKVRSALFFVLYNLAGIFHSFLCVLIGPFLPLRCLLYTSPSPRD